MARALQRRLFDLVSRAGALLGSPRIEVVLPGILQVAADTVSADAYAIWRFDRTRGLWFVASHAGVSDAFAAAMVSSYQGRPAAPVPSPTPIAVEDVLKARTLTDRRAAYEAEGIRSLLAIPLVAESDAPGSLVFYFRRRRRFPSDEVALARALGDLAAAAIRTADLHTEQIRTERHALFLAEAVETLASSLDYLDTLKAVAQMAVPHIADFCAVDIITRPGDARTARARARRSGPGHAGARVLGEVSAGSGEPRRQPSRGPYRTALPAAAPDRRDDRPGRPQRCASS